MAVSPSMVFQFSIFLKKSLITRNCFCVFLCVHRLGLKEQKRKELYAKQGRGSQFTSRDQRDLWIQNELKSLSKAIKEKNEQIERLQEDLKVIEFILQGF